MVFFLPSRAGGGRRTGCGQPVELAPARYLRVQHEHPDLWSRVLAPGAGPRPGRSRPGPNADCVSPAPPVRPAPGLSPLTLRKHCPYMGRFCPVTSARSPGRFREPPPPALPGRAAAPGRGPGFSRAGGSLGAESPRPGSRAPAAGGLRSPASREPPERPPAGWRRSPDAPTPPPSALTPEQPNCGLGVMQTPSGQLPPGRAAPACRCPLPCARPEAVLCQVWSCPGSCLGRWAQPQPPCRPLPSS